MTLTCHSFDKLKTGSEAKPKDLANEKEILPLRLRSGLKASFAQNDSVAVSFENLYIRISNLFRISCFVLFITNNQ